MATPADSYDDFFQTDHDATCPEPTLSTEEKLMCMEKTSKYDFNCPLSHGLIHETADGVRFKMICNKYVGEFGGKIISSSNQPVAQCLNLCAKNSQCKSIDMALAATGHCRLYAGGSVNGPFYNHNSWKTAIRLNCSACHASVDPDACKDGEIVTRGKWKTQSRCNTSLVAAKGGGGQTLILTTVEANFKDCAAKPAGTAKVYSVVFKRATGQCFHYAEDKFGNWQYDGEHDASYIVEP